MVLQYGYGECLNYYSYPLPILLFEILGSLVSRYFTPICYLSFDFAYGIIFYA